MAEASSLQGKLIEFKGASLAVMTAYVVMYKSAAGEISQSLKEILAREPVAVRK